LLVGAIVMVQMGNTDVLLNLFEINFRVGSLIFGGGIVVLPMLRNELVPRGWVSDEQFFQ
jgi:chromate transporter